MMLSDESYDENTTPWFNTVEPKNGESVASFLIRFRNAKANRISSATGLGEIVGADTPIHCWEKLFFNQKPKQEQLEALGRVTRVEVERLRQMFPAKGEQSRPRPIRMCAACCQKDSYHRIAWQYISTRDCEFHRITLLTTCPNCRNSFSIDGLLNQSKKCGKCGMSFQAMVKNRVNARDRK